ncbi:MAG: hypothetical protein NVS3B7_07590 [Candidatus Elarobacter sp.]
MDGLSGIGGSAMDIASNGISSLATSVLASTERLVADEAARLLASLGAGAHVNTVA